MKAQLGYFLSEIITILKQSCIVSHSDSIYFSTSDWTDVVEVYADLADLVDLYADLGDVFL